MCKHIHVAADKAKLNMYSVDQCRTDIANQLYQTGSFILDGDNLLVLDQDNINCVITYKTCTCIASSHGIHCICLQVADFVAQQSTTPVELGCNGDIVDCNNENTEAEGNDELLPGRSSPDPVAMACNKLDDIKAHLLGNADASSKTSIISAIDQIHKCIRLNKFRKTSRKHKIECNSVSRKLIDRSKRIKIQSEHGYSGKNRKRGVNLCTTFRHKRLSRHSAFL